MQDVLEQTESQLAKEIRSHLSGFRWALGIRGLFAIAFGAVILIWPNISLLSLTLVFGAFALFYGVTALIGVFRAPTTRMKLWLLLVAAIDIAAGVVVILYPNLSALGLLYAIGAWAIVIGLFILLSPFWVPGMSGSDVVLLVLTGIVSILFGVVMFSKPGDGALVLLALIAAFSIVSGVMMIAYAIALGHPDRLFKRAVASARRPTAGAHA
jgi:uncharacterized membrane protein HdeD (DUF308 family)